jgi:predicted secreted Zn-dependent protease
MQKVSFEGETLSQFQKEKNYQIELIKIRNDEEINKLRREFDLKTDEVQREIKGRDYQTREFNEKNAYLELKANELKKGV